MLAQPGGGPVVVEAPATPIYAQFAREGDEVVGEAVSAANLPKLMVYHYREAPWARLRTLGWSEPLPDDFAHAGNWTRRWLVADWDPLAVAEFAMQTLEDAYGLMAWAITATPAKVD